MSILKATLQYKLFEAFDRQTFCHISSVVGISVCTKAFTWFYWPDCKANPVTQMFFMTQDHLTYVEVHVTRIMLLRFSYKSYIFCSSEWHGKLHASIIHNPKMCTDLHSYNQGLIKVTRIILMRNSLQGHQFALV